MIKLLGDRGMGGRVISMKVGVSDALGRSMTSYVRKPDYVALKPTWIGNLVWLLLIGIIVSTTIFVLLTK